MLEVHASLLYLFFFSLPFFYTYLLLITMVMWAVVTCAHADMPIVVVVGYHGDVSCGDLRPHRHAHSCCCRWLLWWCELWWPASTQTCPYLLLLITVVMWAVVTCDHADMPIVVVVGYYGDGSWGKLRPRRHAHICYCCWLPWWCKLWWPVSMQTCPSCCWWTCSLWWPRSPASSTPPHRPLPTTTPPASPTTSAVASTCAAAVCPWQTSPVSGLAMSFNKSLLSLVGLGVSLALLPWGGGGGGGMR